MKRATYTQFRDPRQYTPYPNYPAVTNQGIELFNSHKFHKSQLRQTLSRSRRFEELYQIEKFGPTQPAPNLYRPLNELKDRIERQACVRIVKPELVDEDKYEVVEGTAKVLRTDLLSRSQQR